MKSLILRKDLEVNMTQKYIEALKLHYASRVSKAEANLLNYFNNPSGIAEHPDVVAELVKLVDEIGAAKGGLEIVDSLVQPTPPVEEDNK